MDEGRYRLAERQLWEWVGVAPSEQRVHLERNDVTVRIQEVGEGLPVVFVHGANVSGSSWATLAGRLRGFRCILLDRPGTGLSDPLDKTLDTDRLAEYGDTLIVDLLDALGVETAHVVATSFGGYIALRAAGANPGRIERMVQFSWPVGAPIARVPAMMRVMGIPLLGRLMAAVPPGERAVRMMFRQIGHGESIKTGRITKETLDWWLALLRHTDTTRNELAMGRSFLSPFRGIDARVALSDGFLGKIQTPTRFLWGENDPFGGVDTARHLVDRMPNAGYEVLAGAGHAPWLDDHDHAANAIEKFLGR